MINMINFTITTYNFDDEPQVITTTIPRMYKRSDGLTFVVTNDDKNDEFIFISRIYYLTDNLQRKMAYPTCYDYELGSVFMFPEYRQQGLAKQFLKRILCDIIGNIILWTQHDNEVARHLYDNLFTCVENNWTIQTKKILAERGYTNVVFYHN